MGYLSLLFKGKHNNNTSQSNASGNSTPTSRVGSNTSAFSIVYGLNCPKAFFTHMDLADFRFIRAIGHGYASTVFEAEYLKTHEKCVIKVCMKTRLKPDEIDRLRREVRIHSSISHRHILNFYAAFEDSCAIYMVLEYAEQGDLYNYIHTKLGGTMSPSRYIFFILEPVLHAIAYLHERGILWRDGKSENILIDANGIVRLCDMGLAIDSNKEVPRSICGTLEFLAPEVLFDQNPPFTNKVDIWAVGILTYECLVGYTPFHAKSDSEIKRRIREGDVNYTPIKSEGIRNFIALCLQRDPTKRPGVKELFQHPILHPVLRTRATSNSDTRRSLSFS